MKNILATNDNEIKVTVCVVTYNHEKYIAQCLESIVNQETNFCYRVIVADDCSTDSTVQIIQKYAHAYPMLVKLVVRPRNIGSSNNYDDVHSMANSEYVCHCDGDDRWLPGKLQKQADFLDNNKEYSVCWSRVNFFNDSNEFFDGRFYDYSMFKDGDISLKEALSYGAVAIHSSIMYRRNAKITKKPDFFTLDIFFIWEFLLSGKGKILNDVLAEYRVLSMGSLTSNKGSAMKKRYAHHANYFLLRHPENKKEIFIFSLLNFLADIKNYRASSWDFFKILVKSFSFVGPIDIYNAYRNMRKLSIPQLEFNSSK